MEWLSENWVWVLIGIAFIAMHMFGHGGHGGRSGSDRRGESTSREAGEQRNKDAPPTHHH